MSVLPAAVLVLALGLDAVGGTPQNAPAYAASNAAEYVTTFAHPLVVTVRGKNRGKIRFSCISPGCRFPPSDQPDSVTRFDPRSYDVEPEKGKASIELTLATPAPGTFTVIAYPAADAAKKNRPEVRFTLVAR